MSNIPNRWTDYKPYGYKVADTRFVAFKVPLRSSVNERVEETLRLDAELLMEAIPDLGLIIDLTDTDRYYNPECFETKGVQHRKLKTPGHITPSNHLVRKFKRYVNEYLRENEDNSKLIGVHCTHGVNRTGFFICNYMISEMTMSPDDAIKKFSDARGHSIERQNYVRALMELKSEISESESMQSDDQTSEYYLPLKRKYERRFIDYEQQQPSRYHDAPSCRKNFKSEKNDIPLESYSGHNLEFISGAKHLNDDVAFNKKSDNLTRYQLRREERTRFNDEGNANSSDRLPVNHVGNHHDGYNEQRTYYRRERISNWRNRSDDQRNSNRIPNWRDQSDYQRNSNRIPNWRDQSDDQRNSNLIPNWRDQSNDQTPQTRDYGSVNLNDTSKYFWKKSESNTK